MAQVKDVVCGMMVDPAAAAAQTEYKGETYYFCAPGCKAAFEKEPEKYLQDESRGSHQGGHHQHGH